MKNLSKIILAGCSSLLIAGFNEIEVLADDVQNNNIQLSDNHEIKSPVRRLWHTKVIVTTNPKRTLYVEHRDFSSNLDLQSTVSNSDGTTTAYYAGYIWNNNYAIPLRTGETIQATTRIINRTIKYNITKNKYGHFLLLVY